jgi:hypothetical protein
MKIDDLRIEQKVRLNIEEINKTEFKYQVLTLKKDTVIVTSVLRDTFCFKPTNKSQKEMVLPIRFIKEVI